MNAPRLQSVEVPRRLRRRPKDRRGYPVPYIVMVDKAGRPHFTINDQARVNKAVHGKLCGLCGEKLERGAWFVGGSKCFTSPIGAFVDPPMHEECAKYALQVCPFLAAPSYAKRIDDRTLDEKQTPDGLGIVAMDEMPAEQPLLFGLGKCSGFSVIPTGPGTFVMRAMAMPNKPQWLALEFWKDGRKLNDLEVSERLAKVAA